MEKEKLDYLKKKQLDFQNGLKLKAKEENLHQFVDNLKNKLTLRITQNEFPIDEIAKPILINLPEDPVYINYRFETTDEIENVKIFFRKWIIDQKSKSLLIKNENLLNTDDWIEIDVESLINNFDFAFESLDLIHTLIFSIKSKNFINSFEFENDITIYKGTITGNEIKYYC